MAINRITIAKEVLTSRLFRQLSLVLLLAISAVQILLIAPEIRGRERQVLLQLEHQARAIVVSLNRLASAGVAPADFGALAEQLMPGTSIKGGAIYAASDTPRHVFGEMPALVPTAEAKISEDPVTRLTDSGDRYDIVWRFSDLKDPYFIVVRVDSSGVAPALAASLQAMIAQAVMTIVLTFAVTLGVFALMVLGRIASIHAALSDGDASRIVSSALSSSNELGTIGWSIRAYVEGKKYQPANGATNPGDSRHPSGLEEAATD